MSKGILNELFDLSGDVLSTLGSWFGLGSFIDDNIFDDEVAREQANQYKSRLTVKLRQLQQENEEEYIRIMNGIHSIKKSGALTGRDLIKAIENVKKKAKTSMNKNNSLAAQVESEIASVESDLSSSNISRRRKYIPQSSKASYRGGKRYQPYEGDTYSSSLEENIDRRISNEN